jgi:SAM-dependent methyltransferase
MPGPPDAATAAAFARLYDLDLAVDPGDLDLYLALATRADGPILELGVGTGRIAVPLALAGHRVTGVDSDPAMLARATERATDEGVAEQLLELVEADMTDVRLPAGPTFRLAFIALNSIMVLGTRTAQRAAVQTLAEHLAPGGIAVLDAWLPDADDLARYDGRVILEWPRTDPFTGRVVTKAGSAQYDSATATVSLTTVFEEGPQGGAAVRWVRTERLRLVTADELTGYVEEAGLVVELVAGGYDLAPLAPGAERVVLVATKA